LRDDARDDYVYGGEGGLGAVAANGLRKEVTLESRAREGWGRHAWRLQKR
jgi:hypothetical protein